MSKFIMLCGLPASGKSTYANKLAERENAIILSSDELRIELFGDVNHQGSNGVLFEELYRRAKDNLKIEKTVIIDATNINSKKRIAALSNFRGGYESECHYIVGDFYDCFMRDTKRERRVGSEVIKRMYKSFIVPTYKEGWNKIIIHSDKEIEENVEIIKNELTDLLHKESNHDDFFENLVCYCSRFYSVLDLPHDSKWHSLSVSRHTFEVWKYLNETYIGEDKLILLLAAIFHDIGKYYCKEFKEGSRYASFISHENVSAQIAVGSLFSLGFDDETVLKVAELVQLHMRLLNSTAKSEEKLLVQVGQRTFEQLKVLRDADLQAH